MARRRRVRAQSTASRNTQQPDGRLRQELLPGLESSFVPQALLGAVSSVEVVAGALLQLTRDVLLSAVSGAADIGDAALTATASGARGVVSAASRTVENIGEAAKSSFQDAVSVSWSPRGRGVARTALRRPPAPMAGRTAERSSDEKAAGPRPTRRQRAKVAA